MPNGAIGIVVLAAGSSTRMGRPKQLIEIAGVSLVRRSAQAALDCRCGPVVVVLGAHAALVEPELQHSGLIITINPDWRLGMASSLKWGLAVLQAVAPEIQGVILTLADQPGVSHCSLSRIAGAAQEQNFVGIVAARYQGILGAPAYFAAAYFNELLLLDGDAGARSVLNRHQSQIDPIDLPEAGFDLDRPDDLADFEATGPGLIANPAHAEGAIDATLIVSSPLMSPETAPLGYSRRQFIANVTAAGAGLVAVPALVQTMNAATVAVAPPRSSTDELLVRVKMQINGEEREMELDPRVTLLDLLRDHLGLTGSKKGCDHGQCGACTVLVNGQRINSCLSLAVVHDGDEVTTIEGLAKNGQLHPVQAAFLEKDGFQCGYCTPGQICSAVALLKEGHAADDAQIREWMSGNICRCGAYLNIVAAIREAQIESAAHI